jgi:hypothetical protein
LAPEAAIRSLSTDSITEPGKKTRLQLLAKDMIAEKQPFGFV